MNEKERPEPAADAVERVAKALADHAAVEGENWYVDDDGTEHFPKWDDLPDEESYLGGDQEWPNPGRNHFRAKARAALATFEAVMLSDEVVEAAARAMFDSDMERIDRDARWGTIAEDQPVRPAYRRTPYTTGKEIDDMPLIQHKDFTPVCDECGKAGSVISVSTGEDAIPLPDGWTARKEIDWNRYVFFNEDRVPVKTVIACDECNQPQRDTEG